MKKYLCDQMCGELARWLRAAGFDAATIEIPMSDQLIFKKAVEEDRCLLTRDKFFQQLDPEGKTVIYLKSENLDDWAERLKKEGVDWLYHPFSRCLRCNRLLEKISYPSDTLEEIPNDVKEFWRCPVCGGIFWLGSHTEHMEQQLRKWKYTSTVRKKNLFVTGPLSSGKTTVIKKVIKLLSVPARGFYTEEGAARR